MKKDISKHAKCPVGTFVKVTGYDPMKFPLHAGFGHIAKIVLLDPYTLGYQVKLEEGKWLDTTANQFVESDIQVAENEIVAMPPAEQMEAELRGMITKIQKLRQHIIAGHEGAVRSANAVKEVQDKIRICATVKGLSAVEKKNKEMRLRKKRTQLAGEGVKAGKKKAAAQRTLGTMEKDVLKEIRLATSTFVWINGIMVAKQAPRVLEYLKYLGLSIKNDPQLGPDRLGYEMAFAVELGSRAERARLVAMKAICPRGKFEKIPDDSEFAHLNGLMFNTDGGALKIHGKVPE